MEKEMLELLKGMAENINSLTMEVKELKAGQEELKVDVKELKEKINNVYNQTADLTEFKTEVNAKLDTLHDNISNVEIVTATNWADIARLKKGE